MSTGNKNYVDETQIWLDNLIKKSVLLSGISEKQRYQFFKKIMNPVDRLIRKIEEDM